MYHCSSCFTFCYGVHTLILDANVLKGLNHLLACFLCSIRFLLTLDGIKNFIIQPFFGRMVASTCKVSNQVSLTSLTRTPSGSIYHQDLKNIFSVLLYCLDLHDCSKRQSILSKINLKKEYPYTFTLEQAIQTMKRLYIKLQYKSTLTIFSYEINKHLSMELLQIFYFAKLLHCPADKTCKKIADKNTVLQPTPKGLAILHQFCLKMGIPDIEKQHVPKILTTEFNTMQLLEFDRHSRTDQIIHNYHSDKLIFIRIMGPIMNTWSSKNGPDSIKDLGSILKLKSKFKESNLYSSENANTNPLQDGAAFLLYLRKRQTDGAPEDENDGLEANDKETTRQNNLHVSPFHHRFFTNPDSDSHCQYYVSDKGIRFFKEKTVAVNGTNVTVTNCFSGKASFSPISYGLYQFDVSKRCLENCYHFSFKWPNRMQNIWSRHFFPQKKCPIYIN